MRAKYIIAVIAVTMVSTLFFSAYAIEQKKKTAPSPAGAEDMRQKTVSGKIIKKFSADCDSSGWVTDVYNLCFFKIEAFDLKGLKYVLLEFNGHEIFRVREPGTSVKKTVTFRLSAARPARSGTYPVILTAENVHGLREQSTINLKVDIEPPTCRVDSPHDGDVIYTSGDTADITFNVTATDDYSGVYDVRVFYVYASGSRIAASGDTTPPYSITVRDVSLGDHTFDVVAMDKADNGRKVTVHVTVRRR
ncbi:MAG: Ig-like domain-containing protein [Desulfobacterales bacterium]|nr:Ig-like domain-containing protein [Desulfobacterales bacterium]